MKKTYSPLPLYFSQSRFYYLVSQKSSSAYQTKTTSMLWTNWATLFKQMCANDKPIISIDLLLISHAYHRVMFAEFLRCLRNFTRLKIVVLSLQRILVSLIVMMPLDGNTLHPLIELNFHEINWPSTEQISLLASSQLFTYHSPEEKERNNNNNTIHENDVVFTSHLQSCWFPSQS